MILYNSYSKRDDSGTLLIYQSPTRRSICIDYSTDIYSRELERHFLSFPNMLFLVEYYFIDKYYEAEFVHVCFTNKSKSAIYNPMLLNVAEHDLSLCTGDDNSIYSDTLEGLEACLLDVFWSSPFNFEMATKNAIDLYLGDVYHSDSSYREDWAYQANKFFKNWEKKTKADKDYMPRKFHPAKKKVAEYFLKVLAEAKKPNNV